jgi:hypothetical protein
MGIIEPMNDEVNKWLKPERKGRPPYFKHRAAVLALSQRQTPITGTDNFLNEVLHRLDFDWLKAKDAGRSSPSKQNWRWKRHLETAPHNPSPEVTLERAIVRAMGENWSNQMPTASGVMGPRADQRSSVDLVERKSSTSYSLVELKVGSDTPLYAAVECVRYGLLLLWSKQWQKDLGYDANLQPVLSATKVRLAVLAPESYYAGLELGQLASALNTSLRAFGSSRNMELSFGFEVFPFPIHAATEPAKIKRCMEERREIWRGS